MGYSTSTPIKRPKNEYFNDNFSDKNDFSENFSYKREVRTNPVRNNTLRESEKFSMQRYNNIIDPEVKNWQIKEQNDLIHRIRNKLKLDNDNFKSNDLKPDVKPKKMKKIPKIKRIMAGTM